MIIMNQKQFVAGVLIIPVYFPVLQHKNALEYVQNKLNNQTISLLYGELHTCDGHTYPIMAQRMYINWTDVVLEDEKI